MKTHKEKILATRCSHRQLLELLQSLLTEIQGENSASINFEQAVNASLEARAGRRPCTLAEIRGICQALMRRVPGLRTQEIRSLDRRKCQALIQTATTPRQQLKLRTILHGVFEHCRRQEWCFTNPVSLLPTPVVREQEIAPLAWPEIKALLRCARLPEHRACMPPLGLMLWAGIRPAEVHRLCWEDIDWEESVVTLRPMHSKTGGCRHVELHAVLKSWLGEYGRGAGALCPPNWERRWYRLRCVAGLMPWRQDVLRHTYASYHSKYFHDWARLQLDMGHRSASLLRTRYLSMRGCTAANAACFWRPGAL